MKATSFGLGLVVLWIGTYLTLLVGSRLRRRHLNHKSVDDIDAMVSYGGRHTTLPPVQAPTRTPPLGDEEPVTRTKHLVRVVSIPVIGIDVPGHAKELMAAWDSGYLLVDTCSTGVQVVYTFMKPIVVPWPLCAEPGDIVWSNSRPTEHASIHEIVDDWATLEHHDGQRQQCTRRALKHFQFRASKVNN